MNKIEIMILTLPTIGFALLLFGIYAGVFLLPLSLFMWSLAISNGWTEIY
jgi:hypothetical protein